MSTVLKFISIYVICCRLKFNYPREICCCHLATQICVAHIVYNKLTKPFWLDIGLVLFCEFMDLDTVSVHKHAKKEFVQYPAILAEQA